MADLKPGDTPRSRKFFASPERRRRTLAALFLLTVLAAVAQVACNNQRSPTAPALPTTSPAVTEASYTMIVEPWNENRDYPRGGELLVDGQVLWAGQVEAPTGYYYYGYHEPANVRVFKPGVLAPGAHTVSFRVTDQQRSPTGYYLSGWIDLTWNNRRVLRVASWQDVLVTFRTGDSWTSEFVVPASPPS